MATLTEGKHTAEYLLSEAEGHRSRDNIKIASGSGVVKVGTVLGKVTASGKYAPHAPAEKAGKSPPSGIAGIEWLGPILLTLARRGEISWKRYLELAGQNAAQCFGINGRGGIAEGADHE